MLPYRILIFDVFGTFSFSSLSFLIPFLLAFHQHRIRADEFSDEFENE
jgi:hypothetical protein